MRHLATKTLHFEIVHVSMAAGKSTVMEKADLTKTLSFLKSNANKVAILATHRCISVKSMTAKEYPQINHQFDVWHFVKSVVN